MAKQLPFTMTPSIVRYIRQVIDRYESRMQGAIKGQAVLPFNIILKGYEKDETFMSHSEHMRENFLEYLGEAIHLDICFMGDPRDYGDIGLSPFSTHGEELAEGTYGYPVEDFGITIKDINPFLSLWDTYLLQKKEAKPTPHSEVIFSRMDFDDKNRVLIFGSKVKKFQKARKDSPRFLLFKILWEHRKHIVRGLELQGYSGRPLPREQLETSIGLSLKDTDFANLQGVLSTAGMPIKIDYKNEEKILMSVNEK